MEAFDELLARGHSLVIIEHNMDVIRSADYVIDLGPEGGGGGGHIVYQVPIDGLASCKSSYTGQFLTRSAGPVKIS
jgi:excinuclease ABC subunit A